MQARSPKFKSQSYKKKRLTRVPEAEKLRKRNTKYGYVLCLSHMEGWECNLMTDYSPTCTKP
jgi:hypothetical protein